MSRSARRPPARPPVPRAWRVALVGVGLVVATLAVYQPVSGFGYVNYDDPEYVVANPMVQGGLGPAGLRDAFLAIHHGNWHPLTTLSYLLDIEIFGPDPGAQHRVNLVLHALNALLLFLLLERMTGALGRSATVAALFALHPLHVESVAWISQRKDLLSTAFGLAAALAWVGYVRKAGWQRYALTLVFFAAGLLSKAMLVTWPFVLLLLDFWPLGRLEPAGDRPAVTLRRAVVEKVPLFALAAGASALTLWVQMRSGALGSLEQQPIAARIVNAAESYAVYLRQALWPVDLAVLYPWDPHPPGVALGVALVLIAGISLLCIRTFRTRPYLFVGWFWYLGTLFPVIGLVQIGAHSHADRYTYVPLIGVFLAGVWLAGDALRRRPRLAWPAGVVAAALLTVLAWGTRRQLAVWEDSVTLFRHALEVSGRNPVMYNNLGIALAELGRPDEAFAVFSEGLAIPSPFAPELGYNASRAAAALGRPEEALALVDQALALEPDYPEALFHKAQVLRSMGRVAEARSLLERVVELVPDEADPRVELGLVLGQLGQSELAKRRFEEAIALQPLHVQARISRAIALLELGQTEEAVDELEYVLQIEPGNQVALHYLDLAGLE